MSSAQIEVKGLEETRRQLMQDVRHIKASEDDVLDESSALAYTLVREEAPLGREAFGKTAGQLKDAVKIDKQPHGRAVKLDETLAPYVYYVVGGSSRSPGRFVPTIGKRLVRPSTWNPNIGTHPGTPANPFVDRAYQRVMNTIDTILRRITERIRL